MINFQDRLQDMTIRIEDYWDLGANDIQLVEDNLIMIRTRTSHNLFTAKQIRDRPQKYISFF